MGRRRRCTGLPRDMWTRPDFSVYQPECCTDGQTKNKLTMRYAPPTPTRRNCRVESHLRRARNSQLIGHSFDESEQICLQRSRAVLCRRGVNAPVGSRRELVSIIVFTPPTPTRLNSTVASRRRRRCALGFTMRYALQYGMHKRALSSGTSGRLRLLCRSKVGTKWKVNESIPASDTFALSAKLRHHSTKRQTRVRRSSNLGY